MVPRVEPALRLPRLCAPLCAPLLVLLAAVLLAALPHTAAAVPAASDRGSWPLQPRPEVAEGFDPPAERWAAGHRGVDLRGSIGTPVRAARAGTVSFAGRIAGRGVVVVDHGATRTTYEPVLAEVHVGDEVAEDSRIGTLALFGSHCFPRACLHWGLLRGETYLDPLTLVGAGPVRLLPLLLPLPGPPVWQPLGVGQLFRG